MGLIGRQQSTGAFSKLDDISSTFDGSRVMFALTLAGDAFFADNPFTLLVSVDGVVLEPNTAYTIIEDQIKFTSAPANGANAFIVVLSTVTFSASQKFRSLTVGRRTGTTATIDLHGKNFVIQDRSGIFHTIALNVA
tara:strand:+ start:15 stop:425 length:411 start_codon:yes stop_codon:yes gene_type:complete